MVVPGRATLAAAAARIRVIAADVVGLTMVRCTMELYSSHARCASEPSSRCPARRQLSLFKRRLRRFPVSHANGVLRMPVISLVR